MNRFQTESELINLPSGRYMGKIDSHRTTDVRAVLEPLDKFAETHNVAVLAITHPPKAVQAKALHAATGSLAFVAAARLAFLAIEEPETDRKLLLPVKNNLGPMALGLGYRLTESLPVTSHSWTYGSIDPSGIGPRRRRVSPRR